VFNPDDSILGRELRNWDSNIGLKRQISLANYCYSQSWSGQRTGTYTMCNQCPKQLECLVLWQEFYANL